MKALAGFGRVIVLDTSGLLAAVDSSQRRHESTRKALESDPGALLLSPFVLAELDDLLSTCIGIDAETLLLAEVAEGAYRLENFGPEGVVTAIELIDRYRDLAIGLADASLVVRCRLCSWASRGRQPRYT